LIGFPVGVILGQPRGNSAHPEVRKKFGLKALEKTQESRFVEKRW
jgi:hypothetical protein